MGWVIVCFDWLDHVLKPCHGPAEVHHWPHEGLQALPPAGCSGGHPGVCLNKPGGSNVNLRMLQSAFLSIFTFPHSSGSLSPFLPISSDSSGLSVVCALPSPAFTPRTIQFCRTSIGCLCPEKSNCSTEEKKHEIPNSDLKMRSIHSSESIKSWGRSGYVSLQLRCGSSRVTLFVIQLLNLGWQFSCKIKDRSNMCNKI